jgi:hypothetical protein
MYKRIKEAGVHVIGFFDDITYTGSRDVDKNTEKLKTLSLHDWAQECNTEFD